MFRQDHLESFDSASLRCLDGCSALTQGLEEQANSLEACCLCLADENSEKGSPWDAVGKTPAWLWQAQIAALEVKISTRAKKQREDQVPELPLAVHSSLRGGLQS